MKLAIATVAIVVGITSSAFAQDATSTVRIRLSDNSQLVIGLDDRKYNKVNTVITLGGIPSGKHRLKVYKFTPIQNQNAGDADLLFTSKINLEPGKSYDGVVDVNTHELSLDEVSGYNDNSGGYSSNQNDENSGNSDNDGNTYAPAATNANVPSYLNNLQNKINNETTDTKKLALANNYVNNVNSISSSDVRTIANWLMFDDSKLLFLKNAYSKTFDKNNYSQLSDVFSMADSKTAFQSFLKTK